MADSLEQEALGYCQYKKRIDEGKYSEAVLQAIVQHRDAVLEKYKTAENKNITMNFGLGYTQNMLIPTDYQGVFVDMDDVFAAIYSLDFGYGFFKNIKHTYIHWTFLTSDTYMPVVPMIYVQKKKPIDYLIKTKRNDFAAVVEGMCKNLKYPICSIDEFEKMIQKEQTLRGRMNKNFLLGQLYDAKSHTGLFEPLTISYEFGGLTTRLLEKNGYDIPSL